jgi:DNA-binding MarR family transcriptional regulator
MGLELLDPISRLALHVFRAQQSLSSVGDDLTAQWGMTSAKWKVLGAVALTDSPPTASGIGRVMGLTRQAATKQIGLLAEHGLLIPHDNPLDARAAVYTLSPEGTAVYGAISAAWAQRVAVLRESIGDIEISSALNVLEQLVLELEKVRGTPIPAPTPTGPRKPKGIKK